MPATKRDLLSEDQIHRIIKALADPRRYEILKRLRASEDAMRCGCVRDCMPISAATLSHHMKELETAGLIHVVRYQKYASYILRRDVLDSFLRRLKADLD
jgi:ArsR family transcriptional regulator